MKQVIEVRLVNPDTGENIFESAFTHASTHRDAVELALDSWSGGTGIIKKMEKWDGFEQGKWDRSGPCFTYYYHVVLAEEEYDRSAMAVLFAQYREKESA